MATQKYKVSIYERIKIGKLIVPHWIHGDHSAMIKAANSIKWPVAATTLLAMLLYDRASTDAKRSIDNLSDDLQRANWLAGVVKLRELTVHGVLTSDDD